MKLPLHNYLELSGLIIVLLATTLQLSLVSEVSDASSQGGLVRIEEKLNQVWFELQDKTPTYDESSARAESFNYWTGVGKVLDKQKDFFNHIYAMVMLLGSALLVVGRYLEMMAIRKL